LISLLTGLTYKEINIVVYYILIPLVYLALADKIFKGHWLKTCFLFLVVIFILSIKNFEEFSCWLFDQSVMFLLSFSVIGWDYIAASVIICAVIPGVLFLVLSYFTFKSKIYGVFRRFNRHDLPPKK
jgi:hypothetical protein